jgi:hypothetical protein
MDKRTCTAKELREISSLYHFESFWALRATEEYRQISLKLTNGDSTEWVDFDPKYVWVEKDEVERKERHFIHGALIPSGEEKDIFLGWIVEVNPCQGIVPCDVTLDVFDDPNGPFLGTVVTCSWCSRQAEYPDVGKGSVKKCLEELEDECDIHLVYGHQPYEYIIDDNTEGSPIE